MNIAYHSVGNLDAHQELAEKSLDLCKKIGDKNGEAKNLSELGQSAIEAKNYDKVLTSPDTLTQKAEKLLSSALQIYKETGHKNGQAKCYQRFGTLFKHKKEIEKSKEMLENSLKMCQETKFVTGQATAAFELCQVLFSIGNQEEGLKYAMLAIKLFESQKSERMAGIVRKHVQLEKEQGTFLWKIHRKISLETVKLSPHDFQPTEVTVATPCAYCDNLILSISKFFLDFFSLFSGFVSNVKPAKNITTNSVLLKKNLIATNTFNLKIPLLTSLLIKSKHILSKSTISLLRLFVIVVESSFGEL
jgi:tetratricopeptide (TPR) repeat protein